MRRPVSSKRPVASRGSISGSFSDHHLDIQYRWKPNVALGLGYSDFGFDVEIDDADLPGQLDLGASGPELFFRVSF